MKFNYNGSFKKAITKQVIQAQKALFSMLVKAKRLQLSIDTQCELFDRMVLPILLYGSEVWGYENISQIEVFHRKFLRTILHVNKCTPDCMVYGETGRCVILNHVKCRMVGFWLRIIKGEQTKHSFLLYRLSKCLSQNEDLNSASNWLRYVEDILNNAGFANVWLSQSHGFKSEWVLKALKLRLADIFKQDWKATIWSNRLCSNYRMFKGLLELEKYLLFLNSKDATTLCKFRCRSHSLPVNNNRFDSDMSQDDICTLCLSDTGDEFHYIFVCPFFLEERKLYLQKSVLRSRRPSSIEMEKLFKMQDSCQLRKLVKFINIIMNHFSHEPKRSDFVDVTVQRHEHVVTRSGRIVRNPVRLVL